MKYNQYSVSQINVIDLRQKTLLEALFEIEKRPSMWLTQSNIECLSSFINGWIVGRNEKVDEQLLKEFDQFIVNKFHEKDSTLGWCSLIIKHSKESNSLDSFYKLFKQYLETKTGGLSKNDFFITKT